MRASTLRSGWKARGPTGDRGGERPTPLALGDDSRVLRTDDQPTVAFSHAHCLNLDVFAEGGSLPRCVENMTQIVAQVIEFEVSVDNDPYGRPAPEACKRVDQQVHSGSPNHGLVDFARWSPPADVRLIAQESHPNFLRFEKREKWQAKLSLPPPWMRHVSMASDTYLAAQH